MMDRSPSSIEEELDSYDWLSPMSEHKLRLRPWLESMLDGNKIKGLEWLDEKKTCFKIPWKHRSKKDWDTNHVQVFIEWAKHTGKYHEGDQPDYVAMKTRLRCAFNKAPDIEEVKDLHSLKSAEPFKVYRFIQKPDIDAWKEGWAKQPPTSSRVCTVPPTRHQMKEDDSSSDSDSGSDSGEEVMKLSNGVQQNPVEALKNEPSPVTTSCASAEDKVTETTDSAVNPVISLCGPQNSVDTNDAAKLLLSLKGGAEEKTPIVIHSLQTTETTVNFQSGNSVPAELISHLLMGPSRKPTARTVETGHSGASIQNVVTVNQASLSRSQLVAFQQLMAPPGSSQSSTDAPVMAAGLIPHVILVKSELLSPQTDDVGMSPLTTAASVVSMPAVSPANAAAANAAAANAAAVNVQQHVPNGQVQVSKDVHSKLMNNLPSTGCGTGTEVRSSEGISHNTRFRKLRRPPVTATLQQARVSSKTVVRKRRNMSGVTYSNHGNIMATGVKVGVKELSVQKEPVLCEEMLRMREAYGVPVHRTTVDQHSPSKIITKEVIQDAEEEAHSNVDPLKPNPLGQDMSASSVLNSIGAAEKKTGENEYKILDLRISTTPATKTTQESSQILDLSVKREPRSSCCLTEEGALDLTLKRKTENGDQPAGKRQNMKKGVSLTMHAIWDLSNCKQKEEEAPVQHSPIAVDLTHSPRRNTAVKQKEVQECKDDITKAEKDFGDHNYFSTTPVAPSTISQGIVILETDSIDKEFSMKMEMTNEDSDVTEINTVSQVPTLVSEQDALDDQDSFDDDSRDDITDDEDDFVDNDEDNDTKLAAKQLLELSSRCHNTKGKELPSEEVIRAADYKHIKIEQQKKASYSGNNWGADLYRKGSPPSNCAMYKDMSGTRQRLRPWLESKISSGEIEGLEWVDEENGIFKIPWKHGGKHDWTPENSRIFMEWAKHTGRYREGIDEEDYATWKTRLRCAFNKAPDIEEIKQMTDLNCSEPYRVYRLVPKKEMQRFLTPVSSLPESVGERSNTLPEKFQLPSVVEELDDNADMHYPSDLKSLGDLLDVGHTSGAVIEEKTCPSDPNTGAPDTGIIVTIPSQVLTELTPQVSTTMTSPLVIAPRGESSTASLSQILHNPGMVSLDMISSQEGMTLAGVMECHRTVSLINVQLKYQNCVVKDEKIDGQLGCFITSSEGQVLQEMPVITYPPIAQPETRQQNQIKSLLPYMKDGVWLTSEDGSIYARRSCKCGVFYVSANGTDGLPVKLKRSESKEKIFDFSKDFLPALEQYQHNGCRAPDPSVHLIFGQTCNLNELNENILISLTVTSVKAQELLKPATVKREVDNSMTFVDSRSVMSSV